MLVPSPAPLPALRPAAPRRRSRLVPALMATVLVCLAGLPGPRAHDLTPEAAAHIAGTWRLLAVAASDTWRSLDTVLSPVIGVRGRFELARAAGTLQLLLGGVGDEASAPWAVAEAQARRLGREALALDALRVQVEMQLSGGNYGAADALTAQLLERARAAGNGAFQASAEGFLGILARRHGELEAARQHQENALALRRALGDDAGIAQALANLGTVYRDLGDFARALDLQLEALDLRRRLGLGERVDLSYRNIALLYREIEDAEQARANFSAALAAAEARHDPASLATVLGSFASFCNDNGEPNAALRMAQQALAIDERLGNRPYVGLDLVEISRAELTLGDSESAREHLHQALAIGRPLNHREIVGNALLQLGKLALQADEPRAARPPLDEAIALLDAAQLKPQLVEALGVRQQLAERDGATALALQLATRRAALREELLGARAGRQLAALRARYERAEADQRIRLLNLDNEMQGMRLRQQTLLRNLGLAVIAVLAVLAVVLAQRYRVSRRLNRALEQKNAEISAHEAALQNANELLSAKADELYQAAITDPLTGAYNRGYLLRELDERLRRCAAERRPLALLLIDFDHFKQINDQHGHLFGDRVLASGVQVMRQWLEPRDLLGRYGGEEFVVILDGVDLDRAAAHGERLRERMAQALADAIGAKRPLTVSIGVASTEQLDDTSLEALLNAADLALYRAKAEGRNRVVRFAA